MSRTGKAARDAAFSRFMAQASPSLLRTAWLLTGDAERASELVQAALVKTYVAWPRVQQDRALAYARRVLVNHKTDVWRGTRHEVPLTTVTVESARTTSVPRHDPHQQVELGDELVRLLRLLPERQRTVVVLRYYTDLSEQAVAEMLDVSVGSVKSAASRGLATLRSHLESTASSEGSLL